MVDIVSQEPFNAAFDAIVPQLPTGDLFDEFLPLATNAIVLGGGILQEGSLGFLDSALDLIGDLFDPFVPGGAGSERRLTADTRGTGRSAIAAARARIAGTGRRARRRKALTDNDIKLMLTIASSVSKKAAENFMIVRTRGA